MNKIRSLIIIIFLGISTGIYAKNTTTVVNLSDQPITVYFQAYGCFGAKEGFLTEVCETKENVSPRTSTFYKWKWLQTGLTVAIKQGEGDNEKFFYKRVGSKWSKPTPKVIFDGTEIKLP